MASYALTKVMSCIKKNFHLFYQGLTLSGHYAHKAPHNSASQVLKGFQVRARKPKMDPAKLTFSTLIELMEAEAAEGKVNSSSLPNLRSALAQFCAVQGYALERPVGSVLRTTYYDQIRAHRALLLAENRPDQYITNRCALLSRWRRLVADYDRICAAQHGTATPFQLAVLDVLARYPSRKSVAVGAGMPLGTLRRWADGAMPSTRSLRYVTRLENFVNLAQGTLADLLPSKAPETTHRGEASEIAYRRRLSIQRQQPYRLKVVPALLREQWAAMIAYKVNRGDDSAQGAILDDDDVDGLASPAFQRNASSTWRVRPQETAGQNEIPWFAQYQGMYVPTAEVNWNFVSQFFGWLCLETSRGGQGQEPDEACRLSNLARRSLLNEFFKWKIAKADGQINSGLLTLARQVKGLCNPRTGYLTQCYPGVGADSGLDEKAWRARCASCHTFLKDRIRAWEQPGATKPSRDSFEPIAAVLDMPNPMHAVRDMVNRMVAARPTGGGSREAVWARNVLLVKLLASNPLRELNLRNLTIASEKEEGHLRREKDGSWRIFIPREELKNFAGAARDRDYDREVRREVWPDIDKYINFYRPLLARVSTNMLFISERTGGACSKKLLGRCFEGLTRRYLVGCPGVGPHSMRHIVACSHVKANPNGVAVAAAALHDMVETVQKHYARFGRRDVSRWESTVMDDPFKGML